jgi:hypothetical protein
MNLVLWKAETPYVSLVLPTPNNPIAHGNGKYMNSFLFSE